MSGQLLVREAGQEPRRSTRTCASGSTSTTASALDFVDQRTFGHLSVPDLVPTPDGAPGGLGSAAAGRPGARRAHRPRPARPRPRPRGAGRGGPPAAGPASSARCSTRRVVSGIGNIYADEGLWRAQLHYARPTETLRRAEVERALDGAAEVMTRGARAGRDQLRRALRERERRLRVLRPLARRVRAGGPAVPPLRHAGAPRRVHEPLVLQLPAVPAAARAEAGSSARRRCGAGRRTGTPRGSRPPARPRPAAGRPRRAG